MLRMHKHVTAGKLGAITAVKIIIGHAIQIAAHTEHVAFRAVDITLQWYVLLQVRIHVHVHGTAVCHPKYLVVAQRRVPPAADLIAMVKRVDRKVAMKLWMAEGVAM